jgi:hypothetical protein
MLLLAGVFVAFAIFADRFLGGGPSFGRGKQLLAGAGFALAASSALPLLWNERALLLAVSTGVSIVSTEAAVRIAVGPRFATIYELDQRCLHRHIPIPRSSISAQPSMAARESRYGSTVRGTEVTNFENRALAGELHCTVIRS